MKQKITPRKLDKNSDYKLVQSDSMSDALNVNVLDSNNYNGSDAGSMGTIKPVPSSMYALGDIPFPNQLIDGVYRVLSTVTDNKAKLVYYFVWNVERQYHSVYVYDHYGRLPIIDGGQAEFKEQRVYEVYRSPYLNFPQDGFVKGDIVHINSSTFKKIPALNEAIQGKSFRNDLTSDAILYFTDNKNEPKKINVYRCLYEDVPDAIESTNPNEIQHTLDFISACPRTPLERPLAYFQYDSSFPSSNFSNIEGFQFAYQWIYKDGYESAISVYSDIVVPRRRLNQGNLPSPNYDYDNVIHIEVPTGTDEVEKIRILGRDGDKQTLVKIDEVSATENSTYNEFITWEADAGKYYFYNNRITTGVSNELINKQYDNVPRVAQAQTTSNNRLFYGNYVEGYDNVHINASMTPIYNEVDTGDDLGVTIHPRVRLSVGDDINYEGLDGYASGVAGASKKRKAGSTYMLDFSGVQAIKPNSTINIEFSIHPNNNFHFFRNHYYKPTNKHQTVQGFEGGVSQFTDRLADIYSEKSQDLKLTCPYNYYDGNGTTTIDVILGDDASSPLIIKGGLLQFKIEFTWLGPEISENPGLFLADLVTYFIHKDPHLTIDQIEDGLSYSDPQAWDFDEMGWIDYEEEDWNEYMSNITVRKKPNLYYKLNLGHGYDTEEEVVLTSQIVAGKPKIGYTSAQANFGVAGEPLTDENATLIFPFVDNSDRNGIPAGYGVINEIDCNFSLQYVNKSENDGGLIREFVLNLHDIKDIDVVTVKSKPDSNVWDVVDTSANFVTESELNEYFDFESLLPFDMDDGSSFNLDESKIKRQWGYLSNATNNIVSYQFNEQINYDSYAASGYPGFEVTTNAPVQSKYYTFDSESGFLNVAGEGADLGNAGWCLIDGEVGIGGKGGSSQPYEIYNFSNSGSILKFNTFLTVDQIDGDPQNWATGQGQPARKVLGGIYFNGCSYDLNLTVDTEYVQQNPDGIDTDHIYLEGRPSYLPLMRSYIRQANDDLSNLTYSITFNENYYLDPEEDYNPSLARPEVEIVNSLFSYFGMDTFGKYKSFKSSSYHDFGVVYYDERGRHGFVNPAGSVYVKGYSDIERPSGNKGRVSMEVDVTNNPPDWAVRWKLVHSKSTSIDRFIQYTAGGAFVRPDNSDASGTGIDTNVYVSLNYLQESQISYVSAFGARSPEGSILLYSFQPGDKVRVISYELSGTTRYYPKDYVFEVVDAKFLTTGENPLHDGNDNPDFNKTGQFLILRNNNSANGFSFDDVKAENDFWGNNCIIEIFRPAKSKESLTYREIGRTFYIDPTADTGSGKHQCPVTVEDGDVWFRRMPVNMRKYIGNEYIDLLVNTLDDAGVNVSQPNFESFFLESQTSSDLLKADSTGEGRPNIEMTEFGESRNENSVIYSEPTAASSKVIRYSSFNNSLLNFKDLNGSFGDIRYLVDKGDHIVVILEDKCVQLPIGRNILSTSSGNDMVTSSTDVIGDEIFYDGVAGCGDHPESVVVAYDSIYFAHNGLGKVYRLSSQGVQDISSSGVSSFIRESFSNVDDGFFIKAVSGFDYMNDEYLLTVKQIQDVSNDGGDLTGVNYYCGGGMELWKSQCDDTGEEEDGDTTVPVEAEDVPGCMDPDSCNYNPNATVDDGSCTYAVEGFDCEGNSLDPDLEIPDNYGPEENQKKVSDYVAAYGLKYGDLLFMKQSVFNGGTLFQYLNNADFDLSGNIDNSDLLLFLPVFGEEYLLDDYIIEPDPSISPDDSYEVNLNTLYSTLTDPNGYHKLLHVLLNTQESINDWGIDLLELGVFLRIPLIGSFGSYNEQSGSIKITSGSLNNFFLPVFATILNLNESLKEEPILQ